MAERRDGEPAPETHTTLTGIDWYGSELRGQRHERTLFLDLDLSESHCQGMVFEDCTFRRARFNASKHRDGGFLNCTFIGCDFFDSSFTDCKFVGSMFDACKFGHLKVHGGDWAFVGLPGADLRSAAFRGTRLREADLTGARCQGGSLRDVDLSGAWLHSADLSGCDLRGSDLRALEPLNVRLKDAVVTIEQAVAIAEALGLDVRAS